MTEVQGVYAAAITPRGNHGDIDFGASFELIDFLCKGGVSGIALCSAAGEYAALPDADRSRLVYLAVKRSRVPVLAGVGSATLDGSLALAREARDAGVAGVLLPPPHFLPYDQEDLREFYLQFSDHLGNGVATYLSQLPGANTNLQPETASELLATGRFAGIELAFRGIEPTRQWTILASDDAQLVAARSAGAHAALSPAACAIPELLVQLDRAITAHDAARMQDLDARLQEFLAWVRQFPLPAILKIATGLRGLKTGPPSVPLPPEKTRKCEEFRAWFKEWLPVTKKLAANG
jgi:4-hydroxy-tetrahydrodipicolinate synthase